MEKYVTFRHSIIPSNVEKIYIDTGTSDGTPYGHPYAGYYLPYPDTKYEGLVTTITDVAPIMNWVYVDKETYELKYGVRADAQPNLTGPFDCTRQDRRLTFDGWEGWCAVEEFPTLWAVYCDLDDNGLRGKLPEGTRVLEIELTRKEKRWKKEAVPRQEDQTTKREVNATEDTPVDKPFTAEPQLEPPGVLEDAPTTFKPFPIPKTIFPESAPPLPAQMRPQTPPPAYSFTTNTGNTAQVPSQPETPSPAKADGSKSSPSSEKRISSTTPSASLRLSDHHRPCPPSQAPCAHANANMAAPQTSAGQNCRPQSLRLRKPERTALRAVPILGRR